MSRIQPIATSRITDSVTRGRLTSQIQSDQLALFRLQTQLSTGRRIILPSEDPAAAQRAGVLQRTLERQAQSLSNLQGARISLSNTESAINRVSDGLNELRSSALGAIDSFSLPEERDALVIQINRLLDEFTRVGNANFATNFLLGGAERSSPAYAETASGFYDYLGDESTSQTFIDIGLLFDQGVSGDEVLGGLSESVRGFADLNPAITPDTPLSQLNGGAGVTPGGGVTLTYAPSDVNLPSQTVTVDLSNATTVEDVNRLIEAAAPSEAGVTVRVDNASLRIDAADGTVAIGEIAGGSTASELGLLNTSPVASFKGSDLNPRLDITTRLDSLIGSRARGRIVPPGLDNDLTLVANANGEAFNGLVVNYQSVLPGSESATFTAGGAGGTPPPTLTVGIVEGVTTAEQIASLINDEGTYTAAFDPRDQVVGASTGQGTVATVNPADNLGVGVTGGSGETLDLASGLIITNGEPFSPIDTSGFETIEDLLGVLNEPVFGLQASINERGTGLDIRTRRSGADFTIGENGGQLATQLGIRTYTGDSRLDDFNRGQGVLFPGTGDTPELRAEDTLRQNSFVITVLEDGVEQEFTIDPSGLSTVDDLIQQISDDTGGAVAARLVSTGNGIELVATDADTQAAAASGSFGLGTDTLTIEATATGTAGNRPFTVEIINSPGPGSLTTTVTGDTIQVDLFGTPATTSDIAQSIENQLAGFTVTATGPDDTISAAAGPVNASTAGGEVDSALAVAASGDFSLNGESLAITANATGPEGNLPDPLTINVVDSGATVAFGATFDPDTNTVTVELAGAVRTTGDIAAEIAGALPTTPGYSVTPAAGGATTVDPLTDTGSFSATVAGGRAVDSITVSGTYAQRLGFFGPDEDSATIEDTGDADNPDGVLASSDVNVREVDSVFTTLVRLRDAVQAGDEATFRAEVDRLDVDLDRVTFGRAEVGTRLQTLEAVEQRLANEEVTLRDALSQEIDADLAEVISEFTARQFALQASLQTAGQLLNLTILNFI